MKESLTDLVDLTVIRKGPREERPSYTRSYTFTGLKDLPPLVLNFDMVLPDTLPTARLTARATVYSLLYSSPSLQVGCFLLDEESPSLLFAEMVNTTTPLQSLRVTASSVETGWVISGEGYTFDDADGNSERFAYNNPAHLTQVAEGFAILVRMLQRGRS